MLEETVKDTDIAVTRRRFMMTLSYNGAGYHGWQIQPHDISVQECIEKAFAIATRQKVPITGAGRTDTGVNARHSTAHFDLDGELAERIATDSAAADKLCYTLNAILRPSIAIHAITPVANDAHARFDATSRTYRYYIRTVNDPFRRDSAQYFRGPIDIDAMNLAATHLIGRKDFTSFSKLHTDTKTNICNVTYAQWHKVSDGHYYFEITADRFLRNMVRSVVGTLLEVGMGKHGPEYIKQVLEAMNRCSAGTSVPGEALYLWRVEYPYPLPQPPLPDYI